MPLTPSNKDQESNLFRRDLFVLSSPTPVETEGTLHREILEFLAPQLGEIVEPSSSFPLTKILPVYSEGALDQIRKNFLWRDEQGIPTEVPTQMFSRVAEAATHAERRYDPLSDLSRLEVAFYNLIVSGEFIPDSAILRNAGKGGGTVASPVALKFHGGPDEILPLLSIAERAHRDAPSLSFFIEKRGTSGIPADRFLTLLKIFLETCFAEAPLYSPGEFLLEADHPDLPNLLAAQRTEKGEWALRQKILLSDSFMQAVEKDLPVGDRKGRDIFREIVYEILELSQFSIAFSSRPSSLAALQGLPRARGTIDLSRMTKERGIDWGHLREVIHRAVHFLDNILEGGGHLLRDAVEKIRKTRCLGLGVTGLADLLAVMGVDYGSEEALLVTEKIISFVRKEAALASTDLGKHKGVPEGIFSLNQADRVPRRRNLFLTEFFDPETAVMILNCSCGVEPLRKNSAPPADVSLDWALRLQALLEKYSDGWVFKEIVLRPSDGPEDVARLLLKAHRMGLASLHIKKYPVPPPSRGGGEGEGEEST